MALKPDGLSAFYDLLAAGSRLEDKLPAEGWLEMTVPLALRTGDNRREFELARSSRVKRERNAVAQRWSYARWPKGSKPTHVVITRVAPRKLDPVNLGSACKAVIDQIAAECRVNDRHFTLDASEAGVQLRLRQETSRAYGVRIAVRWEKG
jgi:hypothetical protein